MAEPTKINFKNFYWLDFVNPSRAQLEKLQSELFFHPLNIQDCLIKNKRSKLDAHTNYLFITLLFPVYDRATREIQASEIDIFISGGHLITIHENTLSPFTNFLERLADDPELQERYNDKSPEKLLYEIMNRLFIYVYPMIDHLSDDCDNIEKAIFSGRERHMVSEILIIRRNITDFRKIMQVHKNVLKRAVIHFKEKPQYVMKKTDAYFESLIDYTKEIWDTLENLKERIEAIQQTNESQISFRLSDIMRILTIISVITFPITLLATIFGMNTTHAMPFVDSPLGFWYIIGIMAAIVIFMIAVFRKNRWL